MRGKRKEREEEQGEKGCEQQGSASRNVGSPVLSMATDGWVLTIVGHWDEGRGSVSPGGILGFVLNLLTL